jgi:hypothetical protein
MNRLAPLILLLGACAAPTESAPRRASACFFITADCPIANSFAPEINRIVADYGPRGVDFSMVYTDLSLAPEAMRRHAADYGYTSPIQLDGGHALSRRHGVTVTPEVVVLNPDGTRAYRGRIDDRYLAPGKYRLQPTTRELRDAIEAVLAGRPVPVSETKAAGCPVTE